MSDGLCARACVRATRQLARHAAAVAVLAWLVPPFAAAQQVPYPTKTIRMIASQSPGGGIDSVCRIVAPKLSEALGQTVIVDNRPGANGSVAGELTAKAPADGHTLMLGAVGNLGTNVLFYKKLGYEPLADLAAVTSVVLSVNVMVIHPSVPVRSVRELIALVRKRPNELTFGSSGTGGAGYLAGTLFQRMTKTEILHVPYKGSGPAMVDLVAGQTQLGFASQPSTIGFIRNGRLRALAVTTARRSKLLPDLPTIAEAGVPGYESHAWYGFVVPARTPGPIISRLQQEIARIVHSPDANQMLLAKGLEGWTKTPEEFSAFIRSEVAKWTRVVRESRLHEK